MFITASTSSSETNVPAATPHKESSSKGEGYKYGTLSRVRKFRVDGEVIQSTTRRIVEMQANKTLRDNKGYQEMRCVCVCVCLCMCTCGHFGESALNFILVFFPGRKMGFHHLKRLQREEMKETTEFYNRINGERDAQEKKSDMEQQEVERRFEGVSDVMARKQKKEMERLEQQQIQQFKSNAKILKAEQVRMWL